jgi:putative tryptophan/tyrosine transport system substrate-binding protein
MRRRDFILLLASTAAMAPQRAHAQQAVPVVGFLNSASPAGYAAMASAFRQGLKEAGYVEGNNIVIDYRWAENRYETLPALAAGLVERHVTVIFANSPAIKAAKAATSTIPITFISGEDPVRLGFVADLNRPGGNATGVAILAGELGAKRLEFLRELVPHASTIAVLISSDWPSHPFQADIEIAAHAMGLRIQVLRADNEREIEAAFSNLDQARADALLVGPGPLLNSQRDLLATQGKPPGFAGVAVAV